MDLNKQKDKNKRLFIIIASCAIILFTPKLHASTHVYNPNITYNQEYTKDEPIPFATYSNGNVYICNKEIIAKLVQEENDIYIIDQRNSSDPNFCICSSHQITSKEQRNEILELLLEYERQYPTNWDRSIESMRNEWAIHNICYDLGIKTTSSVDVDLNNQDEEKYNSKVLTRILDN